MHTRAEEDLAMIRQLMEESRGAVADHGKHFLIWGILPVIGLTMTYLFATGRVSLDPAWAWSAVLLLGWTASFVIGFREGRRARVATLGRRILTWTWVSVATTLTLIALAGMFGGLLTASALPGLLAVIIAAPIFLTGQLTGERWLGAVAVGWWLGGSVMLFVPGLYTLLLMAAMAVLLMAVPGLMLHLRSRGAGRAHDPAAGSPATSR